MFILMEILNSDFEVDYQLIYMNSKGVILLLFIRYKLSATRYPVSFSTHICFSVVVLRGH